MLKLIKYELKGLYKDIIIMTVSIIIINLLMYTRFNSWGGGPIIACSSLVSFAAMIVVFIWNIKLFSKDIYQDSSYLLFSIPQKGYTILTSKLLTALLQSIFIGLLSLVFNYLTFYLASKTEATQLLEMIHLININGSLFTIFAAAFQYIYLFTLIYFCISFSKMAVRNKKLGKLGSFILFIIISVILAKCLEIIMFIFPQNFSIPLMASAGINVPVNISSIVFNIITFILFFITTSYILENKIDL